MAPMSRRPPLIALTPNALPPEDRRLYKGKPLQYAEHGMARALSEAGATVAVVCAPGPSPVGAPGPADLIAEVADDIARRFDGLVLSGGEDVDPGAYGEAPARPEWAGNPARDAFEIALYRAFVGRGRPVLGICRGAQLIGVAEGGRLTQDIPTLGPEGALEHRCQDRYDTLEHPVDLDLGNLLSELWGKEPAVVNSVHHQALAETPRTLRALARAPDGVLEAFVRAEAGPLVLGVQWHPEWMPGRASQRAIFERFVSIAGQGGA
jgi:putative glutamine amidotransferase